MKLKGIIDFCITFFEQFLKQQVEYLREDGKRASQQDPNGMITIVETDGKVKIPPSNKRGY